MIRQSKLHLMALSVFLIIVVLAFMLNTALMTPSADGNIPVSLSNSPQALATPDGQKLFEQKCKPCHTIGGGRTVGPDLEGVTTLRSEDWLIRFITTPDRLLAQEDPIAIQLVSEYGLPMPNVGVSDDEAKAILAYVDTQSVGNSSATKMLPTTPIPPANSGDGKQLFTGKLPFQNSGPSCQSCHTVSGLGMIGGGTVGKDLTTSYTAFGETGLVSILKTTPFPMMKEIYSVKPLTDSEIADMAAFLKETSTAPVSSSQNLSVFFIISITAALLGIVVVQLLWRGRLSGVRRQLVKGGSK